VLTLRGEKINAVTAFLAAETLGLLDTRSRVTGAVSSPAPVTRRAELNQVPVATGTASAAEANGA
jgi:hypothetical protein